MLSDVHQAERYTLTGRGKGVLGLAQGAAEISLADAGAETILAFVAQGRADGGIVRLGKALVGNSAQAVIDGFFVRIGEAMRVRVTPEPLAAA
jgi:carbon monoxide dehydrogenase subunit G